MSRMISFWLAVAAMVGLTSPAAASLLSPAPTAWERWQPYTAGSTVSVDHSAWDGLLSRHVHASPDGIHRFDYAGLAASERPVLDAYLEALGAVDVGALDRAEQRAYWINLYNALTVRVILDHAPVRSIRDIDISGVFSDGPWGKELFRVEGVEVSLDDIEHRILRPIWGDPRIHYAVNCASLGCPNLQPEAFTGANGDALLDRGAREYVNHPRGARVDGGELYVSSIYSWFQVDFGDDDAGVIAHLRQYAEPGLAAQLDSVTEIEGHDYDWALNGR